MSTRATSSMKKINIQWWSRHCPLDTEANLCGELGELGVSLNVLLLAVHTEGDAARVEEVQVLLLDLVYAHNACMVELWGQRAHHQLGFCVLLVVDDGHFVLHHHPFGESCFVNVCWPHRHLMQMTHTQKTRQGQWQCFDVYIISTHKGVN